MNQTGRLTRRSARAWLLAAIASITLIAVGGAMALVASHPSQVEGPGFVLMRGDRARTGHQRAERLVFLDGARRLAVACPRYNRVVIYDMRDGLQLERFADIPLEGRPVALAATETSLIVLQRPAGDARHIEEAWWDTFDTEGKPIGSRFRVGFDPDDLAVSADGRTAVVLLSGRAEGESNRPAPGLIVVDRSSEPPRVIGSVEFTGAGDDPERLSWDESGGEVLVSLRGSSAIARVDLSDLTHPLVVERLQLPDSVTAPATPLRDAGGSLWVAELTRGGLWHVPPGATPQRVAPGLVEIAVVGPGRLLALNRQNGALEEWTNGTRRARLSLSALGDFEPMALAVADQPEGRWIAVSDRSGSVQLARMSENAR